MPKPVHDLVDKLLDNPDFYPKKSKEDRESTAWAIAYSDYNKNKKKKKEKKKEIFQFKRISYSTKTRLIDLVFYL